MSISAPSSTTSSASNGPLEAFHSKSCRFVKIMRFHVNAASIAPASKHLRRVNTCAPDEIRVPERPPLRITVTEKAPAGEVPGSTAAKYTPGAKHSPSGLSTNSSEPSTTEASVPSAPTFAVPAMDAPWMRICCTSEDVISIRRRAVTCLKNSAPSASLHTLTRAEGSTQAPEGIFCTEGTWTVRLPDSSPSPAEAGYTA